ncbi:unnamed protein product [Darwinula stevensoni]|uniref:MULE transposase domain-containing protein n=1 Tax=Darwinula stevensoni TaxID=69355 RepID=A0A7R9A622_9CRUS|nr:unnamed protein product [Darwinula stevensoni]CAG0893219.1 unnamed protein product [Darwinula stevensoni]
MDDFFGKLKKALFESEESMGNEELSEASLSRVGHHNHGLVPGKAESEAAIHRMKETSVDSVTPTRMIITENVQNLDDVASSQLPSMKNISRTIQRKREKNSNNPDLPQSHIGFEIPDAFKVTSKGTKFLLFDSGKNDSNRILIFCAERNLDLLQDSQHIFMDGTFKVVPAIFFQLFTIHALVFSATVVPLVYVLMHSKTENDYVRVMEKLNELRPNLNPATVLSDFEKASINTTKKVFPEVTQSGCLFLLCQSLYRKVQGEGLQAAYGTDPQLSIHLQMLPALAFVPSDEVADAFQDLAEVLPEPRKKKYKAADDRLLTLVEQRQSRDVLRDARRSE